VLWLSLSVIPSAARAAALRLLNACGIAYGESPGEAGISYEGTRFARGFSKGQSRQRLPSMKSGYSMREYPARRVADQARQRRVSARPRQNTPLGQLPQPMCTGRDERNPGEPDTRQGLIQG